MEIQNNTTPIIISWAASGSNVYTSENGITGASSANGSIIFSERDKCIYVNGVKFALSESEVQTLVNKSISGLNKDNDTIKQILAGYIDSTNTTITTVKADINSVSGSISSLSGVIYNPTSGINAKIDSLSGSIKDLDNAVSGTNGLSKRIDDLSGTVSTLSGALSGRITQNTNSINTLQGVDTQLWTGLSGTNDRVDAIDERLSGAQLNIDTLQGKVEDLSKITDPEEVNKAVETINKIHAEILDPNNASGVVGTFIDAVHGVLNGFTTETDASGAITYKETVKQAIASGVQQAITAASGMNSTTTVEGSANIKVTDSGSNNDHSYKIEASGLATSTELTNTKNELLTGIASGLADAISGASGMNAALESSLTTKITEAQSGATLKWTVI